MTIEKITSYSARWDLNNHEGYLWLWRSGGGNFQQKITDPQEFQTIIDLLRNENPVRFDKSAWAVLIGREPVGEGE